MASKNFYLLLYYYQLLSITLIVLLLFLLISCVLVMLQQTVLAEPSILKDIQIYNQDFVTFKDSFYKISFKYPNDWIKTFPEDCPHNTRDGCAVPSHEPGNPVASFVLPKGNSSEIAVVNINADFHLASSSQNASDELAYYVHRYVESLRWLDSSNNSNNLSMSSGNITTVGGNPAWKISLPDNKGMTSSMFILVIDNRPNGGFIKVYRIDYVASEEEQYLKHLMTVQEMIKSIKFT
jgi:hypothetical protein